MALPRSLFAITAIIMVGLIIGGTNAEDRVEIDVTTFVKDCTVKSKKGDTIIFHYVGMYEDGRRFDSSHSRSEPFTFTLGTGKVIEGLEQGMIGMCEGEERRITIPAKLAYGSRGYGDVIPVSCKNAFDDSSKCVWWAKKGECENNPGWMTDNCMLACAQCGDGVATLIFEVELLKFDVRDRLLIETKVKVENCKLKARKGDTVTYHYKGTFVSGEEFDSGPYVFTVGAGQVIKGMEHGILEMCEGETRKITIPSRLAYGDGGYGDVIPGGATLVFDVELKEISRPKELQIEIKRKVENCSIKTRKGDAIAYHYIGTLENGVQFDSSHSRNEPYKFTLGGKRVIEGMERGMLDMCEGEERKITIPSHLAYGDRGSGDRIPGGATLIFDVELLTIHRKNEL